MASKYKKITISVSNDELNAMEDFLTCKLDKETKEKYRNKVIRIWGRLVCEWDIDTHAKQISKK